MSLNHNVSKQNDPCFSFVFSPLVNVIKRIQFFAVLNEDHFILKIRVTSKLGFFIWLLFVTAEKQS